MSRADPMRDRAWPPPASTVEGWQGYSEACRADPSSSTNDESVRPIPPASLKSAGRFRFVRGTSEADHVSSVLSNHTTGFASELNFTATAAATGADSITARRCSRIANLWENLRFACEVILTIDFGGGRDEMR